jgi:HK97 gp10 family phage protein
MAQTIVTVTGVPEVLKRVEALLGERALRTGTGEILLAVKQEAKAQSSGPARWQNGVNHPRVGGPGIVTGQHRASIHVEGLTVSGRTVRGAVVADSPHSAFLEQGTSKMPAYPFMGPAVRAITPKAGAIFLEHWLRVIGG